MDMDEFLAFLDKASSSGSQWWKVLLLERATWAYLAVTRRGDGTQS